MWRFARGRSSAWLACLLAAGALASEPEVDAPRLRLLPGDLPAAGYFRLRNIGDEPMVLVGARSPAFARVRLHLSIEEGGRARMASVRELVIEPGERVAFAPGGYHLMFMARQRPLAIGDDIAVTLEFADGEDWPVTFHAVAPTPR